MQSRQKNEIGLAPEENKGCRLRDRQTDRQTDWLGLAGPLLGLLLAR